MLNAFGAAPTAVLGFVEQRRIDDAGVYQETAAKMLEKCSPVPAINCKVEAPGTTLLGPPRYNGGKPSLKRSEEHTSELQSLMRISYAVFCLKNKTTSKQKH